jgi:hypothetical protein
MIPAAFYSALGITVFLWLLNGFLDGAKKAQIDLCLLVVLFILLALGFYLFGWKMGVATIFGAYMWGGLVWPIAYKVARFGLDHPPR